MHTDPRGHTLTTDSADAVEALEDMTIAFLAQSADTADHLARTLAHDPGLVLALAARGFFMLLSGRREMQGPAGESLAAARDSLAARGGTARERGHVAALEALADGHFDASAATLDRVLEVAPTDALAVRISHAIRFMCGDQVGMLTSLSGVRPFWTDDTPGAGYIAGAYAFALEEMGDYAAAERQGRRALDLTPDDRWGLHAIAHVHEMRDEPVAGLVLLERHMRLCRGATNFRYHLHWHRALFLLALGRTDDVLALYDTAIRGDETDDFRDIANAASLLFRLAQTGVPVGGRWRELADKAQARSADHAYVFADAHYVMALAGDGRADAARSWLAAMHRAAMARGCQARVARSVGLALAEATLAFAIGRPAEAMERLLPLRHRLVMLGGSHAQRDVFHQLLIDAAIAAGHTGTARSLLDERLAQRPANPWALNRSRTLAAAA